MGRRIVVVSERRAVEVATNFLISFDSNYAQDTPQIYGVYPYKKDKKAGEAIP